MASVNLTNPAANTAFSASTINTGSFSIGTATNRILIAIVSTYSNTTAADVTTVTKNGVAFTQATSLAQDYSISGGRYTKGKVFVFYLLDASFTGTTQSIIATLSASASFVSIAGFQVDNAYQGAPQDYQRSSGGNIAGNIGASSTVSDTDIGSVIINLVNLIKSNDGGNAPQIITATNCTSLSTSSSFSAFWVDAEARDGVVSSSSTVQTIKWNEVATLTNIPCDYLFMSVEVQDDDWLPPDDSEGVIATAGCVNIMANQFDGLDHLEGETVSLLGDGQVLEQQVVSGGSLNLDQSYAVLHVGLPYNSDVQTASIEVGE